MAEKKMTKKDYFKQVIELAEKNGKAELVAFAEHEIELLENKSAKSATSKKAKEQAEIKNTIIAVMTGYDHPVTISELNKAEELKEYSPNRLSALVKQLKDSGEVVRTEIKKVAYFALAE